MLVTLRRLYMYLALTVALLAVGFATAMLLGIVFRAAGLRSGDLTLASVRDEVAAGVAILTVALPVGVLHLWLTQRLLRDPGEASSWPRHLALNAWIVFGLQMVVTAAMSVAGSAFVWRNLDLTGAQVGTFLFAVVATALVWRWRESTPSPSRVWQLIGAFATITLATLLLVDNLSDLANALAGLVWPGLASPMPLSAALITTALAAAVWGVGVRWQWRWRDPPFRAAFSGGLFGVALAVLLWGASDELALLVAFARGEDPGPFLVTRPWDRLLWGAALFAACLWWLLADRGVVRPRIVTGRILAVAGTLSGLAVTFAAWAFIAVWATAVANGFEEGTSLPRASDRALAYALVGAPMLAASLTALLRTTAGAPESALRRAYLFTAIAAALVAAIVTGAAAAYNTVLLGLGASDLHLPRDAMRFALLAAGALLVLAIHAAWLRADLGHGRRVATPRVTPLPQP